MIVTVLNGIGGFALDLLSLTFTLQFNLTTLIVFLTIIISTSFYLIRYVVLARYTRLPQHESKDQQSASLDLRPELPLDSMERKYLPEEIFAAFLSSIKIFNFMEKPVLMEFARHSQQRKLRPNELLWRSDRPSRDLCLVMDGHVNVYLGPPNHLDRLEKMKRSGSAQTIASAQLTDDTSSVDGTDALEGAESHLLNQVKVGGTVSSLFNILSIFTEAMDSQEESAMNDQSAAHSMAANIGTQTQQPPPPHNSEPLSSSPVHSNRGNEDNTGSGNTIKESPKPPSVFEKHSIPRQAFHDYAAPPTPSSIMYARSVTDATLLVIPEDAFIKVCEMYPQAARQIVQIILTRFQRVTFLTLYKYLGLTKELLKIERMVNEFRGNGLPNNVVLDHEDLERLRELPRQKMKVKVNERNSNSSSDSLLGGYQRPNGGFHSITNAAAAAAAGSSHSINAAWRSSAEQTLFNLFDKTPTNEDSLFDFGISTAAPPENPRRFSAAVPATMAGRPAGEHHRSQSTTYAGHVKNNSTAANIGRQSRLSDRELRNLIFECVAKSIGLLLSDQGHPLPSWFFNSRKRTTSSSGGILGDLTASTTTSTLNSPTPISSIGSITAVSTPTTQQLPSPTDLSEEIKILYFEEGSTIIKQGERNTGLFFVVDGVLEVLMHVEGDEDLPAVLRNAGSSTALFGSKRDLSAETNMRRLFQIHPGGLAGYLAALTGHPSFVTIRAKSNAYVGYLSKQTMDRVVERYPSVILTLARRLALRLPPLVYNIDFALEWSQVNAGKIVFQQNDPRSDCIYIVLNGRLRALQERNDGSMIVMGEYSQGESVGELEVLTGTPRLSTVHAIRDTELAQMPKTLFNALAMRHPEITIQISRIIASRSHNLQTGRHGQQQQQQLLANGPGNLNLRTVALMPVSEDVPLMEFADRLKDSLGAIDISNIFLDSSSVTAALGRHAFTKIGKLKLLSWLAEQEERVQMVFYVCDSAANSTWSQRCIRQVFFPLHDIVEQVHVRNKQADCILVVALCDQEPVISGNERTLISMKVTARKELVLLHPDPVIRTGVTREWLKLRNWVHTHHHIQLSHSFAGGEASMRKRNRNPFEDLKSQFEKFAKIYVRPDYKQKRFSPKNTGARGDLARLARRLAGRAVGLVCGGGGARGIAHIGVIQAFEEAGIPIDMVGGVSIGSLIGGLYAHTEDIWFTYWRAKEFSNRTSSMWRQLLDLTYPVTSMFTGHEFNRAIWKGFGESQIEDCWINYFCLTANLTHSRMEIHKSGYLWRYVRASMSLSGYLPPLCDNGNMLVDGGYLNNLPGDVIRSLGADYVLAIDVGSEESKAPVDYGDSLSGWYALLQRWNPFSKTIIPSLTDIQSRLAYVSCVKQLEEVKNMERCIYVRPPVGNYGTLDFGKFEEIYETGYRCGQELVKEWELTGLLDQLRPNISEKSRKSGRRNSI